MKLALKVEASAFSPRKRPIQIELIEPLDVEGATHDFLAEYGPGAHHVAFLIDQLAEEIDAAAAIGFECVMQGHLGTLAYAYIDTFDPLGIYVELVEDPDGLVAQLTP